LPERAIGSTIVDTFRNIAIFFAAGLCFNVLLWLGLLIALRTGHLSAERYQRIVKALASRGRNRGGWGGGGSSGGM